VISARVSGSLTSESTTAVDLPLPSPYDKGIVVITGPRARIPLMQCDGEEAYFADDSVGVVFVEL
jgi:hypothetical protein